MQNKKVNPLTVFIFIAICIIAFGIGFLSYKSGPKKNTSPTIQIASDSWPGCVDKDVIDKLNDYAHQHDEKAFNSLLGANLLTGQCRMFKKGESVYVTDLSMMGYVKIRPQGETQEYWILEQAFK